jgi:hypothetical protein
MSFFQKMHDGMEAGLPITCASCSRIQPGSWRCDRKNTCGGPHSGRDFPDYSGPLQRSHFHERCLVCGSGTISHLMVIPNMPTRFGLCAAHVPIFQNFTPAGEQFMDRIIQPPVLIALPT